MFGTSPVAQSVKNPPTMKETAWNAGDPVSIPGLGRSPGEGNGNPLQSSCLGNAMSRGAWWVKVHGVAKSQTWLNNWAHSTKCLPLFLSKYLPNPLHFCPLLLSLNPACLCVCVCSVMPDSLQSHGLETARLLCPWKFPSKNTGVRCHFLL